MPPPDIDTIAEAGYAHLVQCLECAQKFVAPIALTFRRRLLHNEDRSHTFAGEQPEAS